MSKTPDLLIDIPSTPENEDKWMALFEKWVSMSDDEFADEVGATFKNKDGYDLTLTGRRWTGRGFEFLIDVPIPELNTVAHMTLSNDTFFSL